MLEAVGKKEYPMKEDESLRKNIVGCEKSRAPKRFGYASLYKEKKRLVFILYKDAAASTGVC